MTSVQLIRWQLRHERRARAWWKASWVLALAAAAVFAAFVAWRGDRAGPIAASHAWLAIAIVAHAVAFVRVPFQLYWRPDAALLAQLPIEGGPLLDAALVRCVRAAAATALACVLGAIPLAELSAEQVFAATRAITATPIAGDVPALTPLGFALHHVAFAGVLGLTAAFLLPGVATWAASLVAFGERASGVRAIQVATALAAGNPALATRRAAPASSGTVLGALPGFAASAVLALALIASPWLRAQDAALPPVTVLGSLIGASVLALVAMRAAAPRVMGAILRDVSALDRQRLATLEIHAPTAIERAVSRALGEGALPYRKDARLMRRRYPMAYALGALAFVVLAIVGFARPRDPAPWLVAVVGAAALYGVALAGRLWRPPIELPRLVATLPITRAALVRAKVAWIAVWWTLFVLVPAAFAIARLYLR